MHLISNLFTPVSSPGVESVWEVTMDSFDKPLGPEQLARDRKLVREMVEIARSVLGTVKERQMLIGLSDGSVAERDYTMPMNEEPRDEVSRDHRQGAHKKKPQLDCIQCQQRYAQFRRRQDGRMDVVVALGRHCEVCHEPVLPRAAKFVHRRGEKSLITQMLQRSYEELMEAARDYALICPRCSAEGGRKLIVEKERASIPIGLAAKRKPRSDRGMPSVKRSLRRRLERDAVGVMNDLIVNSGYYSSRK